MKLHVLGNQGPYPLAGGCCSGYLVEEGDTFLALDMGSGCLSRLLQIIPLRMLKGVVLSHLHYDHCGDMGILSYALSQGQGICPLPVYAPEGAFPGEGDMFCRKNVTDGETFSIGALQISLFGVQHSVKGFGMRIIDSQGKCLVYTGDTRWFDGLPALCKNADLLLSNCCLLDEPAGIKQHLTAREVGRLIAESGAKRTLCTHLWGGGYDQTAILKRIQAPSADISRQGESYII